MCLQETKVQDQDFREGAFRDAGYHTTFRGMKGFNGVARRSARETAGAAKAR
jgi:exonuclease III